MPDRPRQIVFLLVVLLAAGAFVGLGLWQVDRLHERRAENRHRRERLRRPPLELTGAAPRDSLPPGRRRPRPALPSPDSVDWRRVVLEGRFDYGREVVLAPRSFDGTPGVYLLTPLVLGDSTAVPVLRGALPAPDGFRAPLEKARPAWARDAPAARDGGGGARVTVRGVALAPPSTGPVDEVVDTLRAAGRAHAVLPRLDLERVRALLPWRVPGFYVRADSTTERIPLADGIRVPQRVEPPPLDDGPHLMYAIQWFAFAVIAVLGGGIYLWRQAPEEDGEAEGPTPEGGAAGPETDGR